MTSPPGPLDDLRPNPLLGPFREILRRYKSVTFVAVPPGNLGPHRYGETAVDHTDAAYIFLDDGITDDEANATLAHELAHLVRPDEMCEDAIESHAAAWLVPHSAAAGATTRDEIEAVARRYGVDPKCVRARARTVTDRPTPEIEEAGEQAAG